MLDLAESSEPPPRGDCKQLFKEQCDYLGIPDSSTINDDDHSDPGIRGLQWVLVASWSRRLWIIQESLLNRNMLMMCGWFEMPWTMLSRLAAFISQRRLPKLFRFSQFRNPDPGGGCASSVLRMGRLRQNVDRLTPIEIIQGANIMLYSDPRD
ncbi:ankyrin and HET domain-containing [Fusarium acutatum]|uniref:Ankyrin and HET domain-containing n=1 Tax=Fusarium acutatum TaxID=78861 RepID=A0A8H4NM04_9HYPO|nr:ankyrin and HET domain-containing [Fusarium acutatum]